MESEGKAIPFITYDPTSSEFMLNDDAFNFLKTLNHPVGIISVAGMYRTGKSYLLNRMLLNKQSGFGVGPSINPCTKGLWMWNQCIAGFTPEGEPLNVLVIDTEGIGALDEDQNHDTKIFSLAILLSSYFIYNSVGSIDENAIQNLNLVINLTKHIHLKAQGSNEDVDPEEYSNYFPAFMWVVRDFTLQLVDEDGEPMTSKEYLDKALQPQKGFSDNIEQKNRIRRFLRSFFKEMDCCTVVRPLTKEEDLQNLDKMDFDKLRSEFVEQVMQLRRKVINKIKPKTLNAKAVSGEMLCTLAQNYINAFNKGVVPNIENAWTYICKNECLKALHEGLEKYDLSLKDLLYGKLPMDENELISHHKEAKESAVSDFTSKAVGNLLQDYLKDLKMKMHQKYYTVRTENEKESKKACQAFLSQSYLVIERKLKNNEFMTFSDYEKEIKMFQHYFIENGPPGPNRVLVMFEFLTRVINDASDYFTKSIKNLLDIEKAVSMEKIKKYEETINENDGNYKKEREVINSKLIYLESTKAELEAKEMSLKESLNMMTKEKEALIKSMNGKMDEYDKVLKQKDDEYSNKLIEKEESIKEKERKILIIDSEYEKQKALMEQKSQFLEKAIEEYKKKDKENTTLIANLKKEQLQVSKENSSKHDIEIKAIADLLTQTKERLSEAESSLLDVKQKYEIDIQKWDQKESSLRQQLEQESNKADESIENLEKALILHKKEITELLANKDKEIEAITNSSKENEINITAALEQQKNAKTKAEKEYAMLKQKIDFYEMQLTESKKQLEESQNTHQSMVKALEWKSNGESKEEMSKQMEQMKSQHVAEIKKLEEEYEIIRKRLTDQVEQLTESTHEMEVKIKNTTIDTEKTQQEFTDRILELEAQKQALETKVKQMEAQKSKLLAEVEKNYQQQIISLEKQIEEKEQANQNEISNVQKQSEESLSQLKNVYEMEKERLEHRIIEEREKVEKKYTNQVEELEQKIKEEQQQHNDECLQLQDDLRDSAQQSQSVMAQMESDINLLRQRNESLETFLKESKESIDRMQLMHQNTIDQQTNNFNQERTLLNSKAEKTALECSGKERIIATLENKIEALKADIEKKELHMDEIKKESIADKGVITEKYEALRLKYSQTENEFVQKNLEFVKESALLKQQIEFNTKKIEEMNRHQEEVTLRYEEKLKVQKLDLEQSKKEKIEKLQVERDLLEQKLENKKKTSKENELHLNQTISKTEKDIILLTEKLKISEAKLVERDAKYIEEKKLLTEQLTKASQNKGPSVSKQELDKLHATLQDLERDLSEVTSNYDRDKALWEGKFQFLEQQKDQAKADLSDSQRKFELTIEQLQKKNTIEKEKIESNYQMLISTNEQRYKAKCKDEHESHQLILNELTNKLKQVEKENKAYMEKVQCDQKGKISEQSTIEKKVSELMESEKQLQKEYEACKAEKDAKVIEYQRLLDKEKEAYKVKMQEAESKYKESESKRSMFVFDLEKERAKWALEKDHILNQRNELQEANERIEKKKEALLRENEKLKNEKTSRRPLYSGLGSNSIYGANRYNTAVNKSTVRDVAMKENMNQDDTKSIHSNMSKDEKIAKEDNPKEENDKLKFKMDYLKPN